MIKVGLLGRIDLGACELVRILINHPDVELRWVADSRVGGTPLARVVPGIIGECDLVVEQGAVLDDIDLLYLSGRRDQVAKHLSSLALDGLRVIDLSGSHNLDHGPDSQWTYGLSEMQRRVLVHDAPLVTVPGIAATASLLALMPMARNLLINSPLSIQAAVGASVLGDDGKTIDGLPLDEWAIEQQQEIALSLSQCQSSFGSPVSMTVVPLAERRTLAVAVRLKCGMDGESIRQLYEQYYDDHNFVFLVDQPIVTADVENTNKCLLRLDKNESSGDLTVHAVMDVLLKGSAGNAVHSMNLMFGLHERAGLALKGTGC